MTFTLLGFFVNSAIFVLLCLVFIFLNNLHEARQQYKFGKGLYGHRFLWALKLHLWKLRVFGKDKTNYNIVNEPKHGGFVAYMKSEKTKWISVARDFSKFPQGCTAADGDYNATKFREEILVPALKENDIVYVNLNGTLGFASSWLQEAFGGLINEGFTLQELVDKLKIDTNSSIEEYSIYQYIYQAEDKKNEQA